jgi:UDP-2,3-diacylglucosamine hydrolase
MEAEAATAEELYVLGDLFEYWVGDDDLDDPFNAVIAGFFRRFTAAGGRLALLHGNRDFLVGKRFAEETGAGLLGDPALVGDTLLMHCDTLCTDDQDYQSWRRTARSADWQRQFLGKPLAERRRVVRGLREKSKEVIQAKPADIMDVNDGAVREALRRHRATRLIHGHTHRPGHHVLDVDGRRCERWVLPDWYGAGGYLEIRDGAARLVRW